MSLKMNGADFKRFYCDEAFWGEGTWYEDAEITIDGVDCDDPDIGAITDSAKVIVAGGVLFDRSGNDTCSFETFARRWVKAQAKVTLVVEVDKAQEVELRKVIASNGGKVR